MANTQTSTETTESRVQYFGPYENSQPITQAPHCASKWPGPNDRDNPTIEPGMLVCLIAAGQFRKYNWGHREDINSGIYGHPALILDVDGNNVKLLVISSQSITDRSPYVVMQHLPIYPREPHPFTGEQLMLSGGPNGDRCHSPCYVKVYQVYDLPRRILLKNVDPTSKRELRLCHESFEYVKSAVANYQEDNFERTRRPFPGFPGVTVRREDLYPSPPLTPLIPPLITPSILPSSKTPARQQTRPRSGWSEAPARQQAPNNGYRPHDHPDGDQRRSNIHRWPPAQDTTPNPQWQPRSRGNGASSGGNGGNAFQNSWTNRRSRSPNQGLDNWRPSNDGYHGGSRNDSWRRR